MARSKIPFAKSVRGSCDDWLQQLGFHEIPAPAPWRNLLLCWTRPHAEEHLVISFQRQHRSFNVQAFGSEFTAEVSLAARSDGELPSRTQRIYFLLDRDQLGEMEALHRQIAARLPGSGALERMDLADRIVGGSEVQLALREFNPNQERWFRTFGKEDFERWAEFLKRVMPQAIERFLEAE